MNEEWRLDTLVHLGLWLLIAAASVGVRILPLSHAEGGWPRPDLLLVLTMAWILRRPAHIPALAVALVPLTEDLSLLRPPGLWTLAVLAGTEFLRRRQTVVREMNLALEWAMVAAVLVAMTLAARFGLAIVMVPRDPLGLSLGRLAVTILIYPLVVWFLQGVLQVRKPATGEVDERGRRL